MPYRPSDRDTMGMGRRAGSAGDFWFGDRKADFGIYENLADSTTVDLAVTGVNPKPMRSNDPMRQFWDFLPKELGVNDHHLISADVASMKPNPWGLYDMNGNVAEWTRSDYLPYPLKEKTEKVKPEQKVVRGGSWRERRNTQPRPSARLTIHGNARSM